MAVQLGSGEYTFEVIENWAKVPEEITLGDCAAVGVDRQNRVYAFNRGEHPVAVFDAEGNLLRTWGEGVFHRPHGVHMGTDDTIFLTDDGDHTVRQELFGQQVLENVPLAAHIRHSLEQDPERALPEQPFLRLLQQHLDPAEAERVLKTVIEWGRHGEVFEYDFHAGSIHLPDDQQDEAAGRRAELAGHGLLALPGRPGDQAEQARLGRGQRQLGDPFGEPAGGVRAQLGQQERVPGSAPGWAGRRPRLVTRLGHHASIIIP